jgi:hypothetical protein
MGEIFKSSSPTLVDQWRAIVLFGANVASYKFALAKSLIELRPNEGDLLTIESLAVPFARNISEHLKTADRQATSKSSRFLDICRRYNEGAVGEDELIVQCSRLGFANVIDAFHIVNSATIPDPFYIDERKQSGGIRITDSFSKLLETQLGDVLNTEVESRWRLVETAWELGLNRNLVSIDFDPSDEMLFSVDSFKRRKSVTSSRGALNGYQKGRCFYCHGVLDISSEGTDTDVDHFFPHVLKHYGFGALVDGVWNLVLACRSCNRGQDGKSARLPSLHLLERLHDRNEFLILSHHPLRETIMSQTGPTREERVSFLNRWHTEAAKTLVHMWEPNRSRL